MDYMILPMSPGYRMSGTVAEQHETLSRRTPTEAAHLLRAIATTTKDPDLGARQPGSLTNLRSQLVDEKRLALVLSVAHHQGNRTARAQDPGDFA